jgi:hypothetical protein
VAHQPEDDHGHGEPRQDGQWYIEGFLPIDVPIPKGPRDDDRLVRSRDYQILFGHELLLVPLSVIDLKRAVLVLAHGQVIKATVLSSRGAHDPEDLSALGTQQI